MITGALALNEDLASFEELQKADWPLVKTQLPLSDSDSGGKKAAYRQLDGCS